MKIATLASLGLLGIFLTSCNLNKKTKTPPPAFSGIVGKAKSAAGEIAKAREDGKAVKKLQLEAMDLLDRLDYKATILLEQ